MKRAPVEYKPGALTMMHLRAKAFAEIITESQCDGNPYAGDPLFFRGKNNWFIQYRPQYNDWITWGHSDQLLGDLRGDDEQFIKWCEKITGKTLDDYLSEGEDIK